METPKLHAAADHIIWLSHEEQVFLNVAKLQKLLYLAQGWRLAASNGDPLFEDDFEGWKHGPASVAIHRRFSGYLSPLLSSLDLESLYFKLPEPYEQLLSSEEMNHLSLIFATYGKASAYWLEDHLKKQYPWKVSRLGLLPQNPGHEIIQKIVMQRYFAKMIQDAENVRPRHLN